MRQSLITLLLLVSGYGFAADAYTDAVQQAYVPYRVALFKTNSNAPAEAQQAVEQASGAWQQIVVHFQAKAPAPYDRDTQFVTTLAAVSAVYQQADQEIKAGQLSKAHETLEGIRELLAQQRQRNQVITFSDHMNAYHAMMETVLNNAEQNLANTEGLDTLLGQASVLTYLQERLEQETPAHYRSNPEFTELLKAQKSAIAAFNQATRQKDVAACKAAIGKLKAPYSKLFLKFG